MSSSLRSGGRRTEKQPTGRGPEGCVQNGPPARREEGAYLNRSVTEEQRGRRPIFNATPSPLYARRHTRHLGPAIERQEMLSNLRPLPIAPDALVARTFQ